MSKMDTLSDGQLLSAVLAGEMDALAARHQGPLTSYPGRLVGPDWTLAQDLAQKMFLRVLRRAAVQAVALRHRHESGGCLPTGDGHTAGGGLKD